MAEGTIGAIMGVAVVAFLMTGMLIYINEQGKEIQRLQLQRSSLMTRLRELGVQSTLDPTELLGIKYQYTRAAQGLLLQHYYPSSWNLERQLDQEAYELRMEEEAARRAVEGWMEIGTAEEPANTVDTGEGG